MAFYKRVNLVASTGEKLGGWIQERFGAIGSRLRLEQDEFNRAWSVVESGDQLILESQVDPRHVLSADVFEAGSETRARRPRKLAAAASESVSEA